MLGSTASHIFVLETINCFSWIPTVLVLGTYPTIHVSTLIIVPSVLVFGSGSRACL